jgi:hypothetical protein
LGEIGPSKGEPTHLYWPFWWNLLPLAPWTILVLLFLLDRNRRERAWTALLVAIPLAMFMGAVSVAISLAGGGELAVVTTFFGLFVYVLASWCAASFLFAGRDKTEVAVISLGVFAVACVVGNIHNFMMDPGSALGSGIGVFLACLAVVAALSMAARFSRKKYEPGRFRLYYVLSLAVAAMGICGVVGGGFALFAAVSTGQILALIFLLMGVAFGAGMFAVTLNVFSFPFLLLLERSACYRARFYAVFQLPGMGLEPAAAEAENGEAEVLESTAPVTDISAVEGQPLDTMNDTDAVDPPDQEETEQ